MRILIFIALLCVAAQGKGQIYINSYQFAPAGALLLDQYPGAEAAYSFRKLRTAYTGDCIVVRRAVGTPTLDTIGFVNDYLDTATLKTFCAGVNCFVRVWYDQTGNNHNFEQDTNANQPRIANGGVLEKVNGDLAINFDVVNDFIQLVDSIKSDTSWSIFELKGRNASTIELLTFTSINTASPIYPFLAISPGLGYITNKFGYKEYSYAGTGQRIYTSFNNNISQTGLDVYENNTLLSGTAFSGARSTNFFRTIGRRGTTSLIYAGNNYHELIFYFGDKSADRNGINTNINNFYSVY